MFKENMDTSPNMMNTSRTLGPQTMSTMSSAMSPAKSPAKTQISLTMLSGYILAGLVLIGLIVMVVLYMKKPCSPGQQMDCTQCAGTNVTCDKQNGCTSDCSSSCNTTGTGLTWKDDQCTVNSDWTGLDLPCPTKCKLNEDTESISFSTIPGAKINWPSSLCPNGYRAQDTTRDPRTSSGICTQGADQGISPNELAQNCSLVGMVNPECNDSTKINPYKCCLNSDTNCINTKPSNDDGCMVKPK